MYERHFKTSVVKDRAAGMHPIIRDIMEEMLSWFNQQGLFATITCTVTLKGEDKALGRTSRTHREGRAFDLRTWDLPKDKVAECVKLFEETYGHLGAISSTTGKPRLIVWHDAGTGAHLHVQISSVYTINAPIKT